MTSMPAVIVKKSGFLSALCYGVFGLLMTCVVCGSVLGFTALRILDRQASNALTLGGEVLQGLPRWKEALPPTLADALSDRRAPEYRDRLEYTVRLEPARRDRKRSLAVVEVKNTGDQIVSLLALDVVVDDERGVPVQDFRTYAATPLAFDEGEWRGPLYPGTTVKYTRSVYVNGEGVEVAARISDLRVFTPRDAAADAAAPDSE